MLKLKEIIFSITKRCNLKCRMCDIPYEKAEELATFQWERAIKDASLIGAQTIVFSGGEPLLRDDLYELISFTKKNFMSACLTSNGYLINEECASELYRSGINVVNISIEGKKEIHDYLRGDGIFDRAILALENLRKYKIESTIASTVSRYNYEGLIDILKLARKYEVNTVRFQPFNKIFLKDALREKDFLIDKNDTEKVQNIIEDVIRLARKYNISTNSESYLREIPFYLSGKKRVTRNGCSALWTSCPIDSKGDVFPCWVLTEEEKLIGNIKHKRLLELWLCERHDQIRKSITQKECPGCMMSCYDEAFGKDEWKVVLAGKIKKIKKVRSYKKLINKLVQFSRGEIIRLKLRYRFYKSYNGPINKIFKRVFNNIRRRIEARSIDNREQIRKAFSEINLSKEKLKQEISTYL